MADPTLELAIPYYGDPGYLRETVTSLLAQDDPDWTATVIDDCYPDPAASQWVSSLADPRVRVVRHAQNLGVVRTYGEAIAAADADYLVILGCDDRLLPHYVRRMKGVARSTGASVVQPGVRVIDDQGRPSTSRADRAKARLRPSGPAASHRGEPIAASLLRGNWTYFPSLCWHRSTILELGLQPYEVVQDLALLIDVLRTGGALAVDPEVTFEYRRHGSSVSSLRAVGGTRFDEERTYLTAIARDLDELGWSRAARAARLRLTSRAHAITLVPQAVRTGDLMALGRLARHAVGQ